jgi:hypothetical protein
VTNRLVDTGYSDLLGLIGRLASQYSISQPLVRRVDQRLTGSLDEEVRDEGIGLDGDGVIGPQCVFDVLGVLLRRALRITHQPVWAPMVFENFFVNYPEHLDAMRTWRGRLSWYLSMTSARL